MYKIKRDIITFKVSSDMKQGLDLLAKKLDMTKATAIRHSISEAIKNNPPNEQ